MAFCQHCGKEVLEEAVICVHCGRSIRPQQQSTLSSIKDEGGFLWGLLGFMVPVAGLIVYLIWKEDHPNNARAAGIGALIYLGIMVLFLLVYIIVFVAVFALSTGVILL